jgi:hypothetical protein
MAKVAIGRETTWLRVDFSEHGVARSAPARRARGKCGKGCKAQQPKQPSQVGIPKSCDGCEIGSDGNCIAG